VRHLAALPRRWRFASEPFELFLALAALFSGLSVLLGTTRPGSLSAQMSPIVLRAWGASLSVGGALTIASRWLLAGADTAGAVMRALRLEQMGMTLFATTAGMYSIAIMAIGRAGLAAGPIIIGWSLACAVRTWIIRAERRTLPPLDPGG